MPGEGNRRSRHLKMEKSAEVDGWEGFQALD